MTMTLKINPVPSVYDIAVTDEKPFISLFKKIQSLNHSTIMVITNTVVHGLYGKKIDSLFKDNNLKYGLISLPDGEKYKNLETVRKIYDRLISYHADRSSLLIAFGGGVVGDITGFTASTYMRGIKYIQAPTTLLAQVDAAIGGKTGVDHPYAKNIIGSFYQPHFVYSNINFLMTLSPRMYTSGLAEVIKYGAVNDEALLKYIEKHSADIIHYNAHLLLKIISDSSKIKLNIVQNDEKETSGIRMVLNFGHTFGHAIEVLSDYKILHGEAVGTGMIIASKLSHRLGLCNRDVPDRIEHLIREIKLPVSVKSLDINRLSKIINYDKKNKAGMINLILLKRIGVPVIYKMEKRMLKKILMEVKV